MNGRYTSIAISVASIIAAFAAVVWWMDPFLLFLAGISLTLWLALPVALIAAGFLLYAVLTGRARTPALTVLGVALGFVFFVGLAIPANDLVQKHAVTVAKAFPAQIAPLLEAYRQAHGVYPKSLGQLPSKLSLPSLMQNSSYSSDGQTYSFCFPQPGGLIDVWDYDSRTRTWHLST